MKRIISALTIYLLGITLVQADHKHDWQSLGDPGHGYYYHNDRRLRQERSNVYTPRYNPLTHYGYDYKPYGSRAWENRPYGTQPYRIYQNK